MADSCPVCGQAVKVHASDEGTASYVRVAEQQRDRYASVLRWLVALDQPGSVERRTVTLTRIIERAREALDGS